ncbi:MAG: hypothetical protein JW798_14020 [Prolixibacteraceae bacterium]|nr:hypothetical protein [Prolixibacteraceae bacterium]
MKTQFKITMMLIAVLFTVSIARAEKTKNVDYMKNNLREVLRKEVVNDISDPFNFLYQEEVIRLNEDVKITFYIDKESKMKLITVLTDNDLAKRYVTQLFEDRTLDVNSAMTGKSYQLTLKIMYRAV